MNINEAAQPILGSLTTNPSQDTNEVPIVRQWNAGDLWHGIPEEFHGAELSEGLRAKLAGRPLSVAMVGQPGTGKTRALWAMVHRVRATGAAMLMGTPVERWEVTDGAYTSRRESSLEAIARTLAGIDRVRVVTEVGDIRAHRYDRARLDTWVAWPHWLCIDDIGAIEPNEWVREALYHLANERRGHGRTTVWTSNLTPTQLRETFGGAIASRILGGVVIEGGGRDRRVSPAPITHQPPDPAMTNPSPPLNISRGET